MYKRILSAILAVLMMASMNTPVIAEGQTPAGEEPVPTEVQETPAAEEDSADKEEPEAPAEDQPEAPAEPGDEAGDAGESGDAAPADEEEPAVEPAAEEVEPAAEEAPAEEAPAQEITLVTPEPVTFNGVTVTVSYLSDAFDGKNVSLVVGEAGAAETAALDASGRAYKAVDVSFVDENGNPVQPAEGKTVSVALKADGMEAAGDYEVVHVDAEGNTTAVLANVETSNPVTEPVKTGVTTRTVEVPAETETVIVEDYEEETYTDYETVEKTIEVPAEIGYRTVRKSRVVEKTVISSGINKILWLIGLRPTPAKKKVVEYYYVEEPYEITPAHTETITETVPVTRTRKVLVGTHEDTKVIKEAYSYEVTEDVYEDITRNDVETSFSAASFSVYAIVAVEEDGSLDFDETFGADHITVKAPAGAFEAGTTMKIETVDDPEVLAKALKALDDNTYRIYGIDISFWKDGTEVEPKLPVKVTWTSSFIDAGDTLVHIKDDGTAEKVDNVLVKEDKTVFTTDSFSTYVTVRQDVIYLNNTNAIIFNLSTLTKPDTMPSGTLTDTHPKFDGYTFRNATIIKDGVEDTSDPVVYLGEFIYYTEDQLDEHGEPKPGAVGTTYIYYRTESTAGDSDLIVKLAQEEMIRLNYDSTPLSVTYIVRYNGTNYTLGAGGALPQALKDALGADADALVVNGPATVSEDTYIDRAITLNIPRGYSAKTAISGTEVNTVDRKEGLGEYTEPTYSLDSNNKIITKSGDLSIEGVYDFIAVNDDPTVVINLYKRSSFTFDASYFLSTVYTGGSGRGTMGDDAVNTNSNARVTGDGTLARNGAAKGTKTFSADSVSWTFETNTTENSTWLMDALEINGTTIEIPYAADTTGNVGVSKTTTLPSGTVVTVSLDSMRRVTVGGNYRYQRTYTISVTNCYEDVVISGGNIYNSTTTTEIIPEVLDNVTYEFYGYLTSDLAVAHSGLNWHEWGVSEPIAVGDYASVDNRWNYNMYGFNQTVNQAMRFKLVDGYVNPQIAYVTSTEGDLVEDYLRGLTLGEKSDGYYPVTSEPDANGYYSFRITGQGDNTKLSLLRIKAELALYDVSYSAGTVSGATIPAYDAGGYNAIDKTTIVLDKSTPVDSTKEYTFLYYTIQGDTSGDTYAPSQKIPLEDVARFGKYDSATGRYVIPFVANWKKSEQVDKVTITAKIYLDGELDSEVNTQIPEGRSVYIDIDSETMGDVMDKYNWQAFYDEAGSNPFVENVMEDTTVELRLYSKFYVYHPSTGKLELHTTKELEQPDGSIGKLNIVNLTNSGYLYGGYYADYIGGHEGNTAGGKNLVKAAADDNNENGTLTANDINALHEGKGIEIATVGTVYDPAKNPGHVGYWENGAAFTTEEKAFDTSLFGDRGTKDPYTATDTTGGAGTEVHVARAGIYYIKEVPNTYLRPIHITTYQRYEKYLRDFILLSSTDDLNYQETGFIVGNEAPAEADFFADKLTINFGPNWDPATVTDGKIEVEVTKATNNLNQGGFVSAYRIFHLADESNKNYDDILGTTQCKSYWVTPDGIQVVGNRMRREIVKDKNGNDIIEVYTGEGTNLNEITFRDLAATIHAAKQQQ